LREAIAQMEEFSYTVSHDLRAPLRGMQGYSQVLLDDFGPSLPPEAEGYLKRIAINAARLDRMILDVLTFTRLARAEFRLEPVPLDRLVRQIVEQYPGMQSPQADMRIDPLADVLGHEASLTQAISNLLNNAMKFVPLGVTPRIRVWTERRDQNIRLWVEDNGIGVNPQSQHRLFNMFERVHPHLKCEGTGVGLAIVRKAVERMGGTAGMESDGVNGSRFWIEVKAADA
jgi:signal transduction histidine kinase